MSQTYVIVVQGEADDLEKDVKNSFRSARAFQKTYFNFFPYSEPNYPVYAVNQTRLVLEGKAVQYPNFQNIFPST